MMRCRLLAEKPDEIEFTLKITMTAKEWETLRDQLSDKHPSWKLTSAINSLLADARKIFWHDDNPEGKAIT